MTAYKKGVILILISVLFFSLNITLVKVLTEYSVYEKIFIRNFLGVLIILPVILLSKSTLKVKKGYRLVMFFRCFIGMFSLTAFYYAIEGMNLADVDIINKLNAFFVMIFAWFFLKEKLHKFQWGLILLALAGAVLVIKPSATSDIGISLVALMSAVFAAAAYTTVRKLSSGGINTKLIVFYFSLFTTIVSGIFMIKDFVFPKTEHIYLFVIMAVVAILAQLCLTAAYKYAEASKLSIYTYTSLVYSSILSIVVFGEIPGISTIIGGSIIVLSGCLNFLIINKSL